MVMLLWHVSMMKATVKRFYKENGHIRLQPENDDFDPIIVDDCHIEVLSLVLYETEYRKNRQLMVAGFFLVSIKFIYCVNYSLYVA